MPGASAPVGIGKQLAVPFQRESREYRSAFRFVEGEEHHDEQGSVQKEIDYSDEYVS